MPRIAARPTNPVAGTTAFSGPTAGSFGVEAPRRLPAGVPSAVGSLEGCVVATAPAVDVPLELAEADGLGVGLADGVGADPVLIWVAADKAFAFQAAGMGA
jgi:hypothetical protein